MNLLGVSGDTMMGLWFEDIVGSWTAIGVLGMTEWFYNHPLPACRKLILP
jgi:hypothetical protein